MTDTTDRAPWCPRCGGDMVHLMLETGYEVGCDACEFGVQEGFGSKAEGYALARRLIRAELARQALEREMANYELGYEMARFDALAHYEWLGANPLRLPGEGA